jgi:hypothetical protein
VSEHELFIDPAQAQSCPPGNSNVPETAVNVKRIKVMLEFLAHEDTSNRRQGSRGRVTREMAYV